MHGQVVRGFREQRRQQRWLGATGGSDGSGASGSIADRRSWRCDPNSAAWARTAEACALTAGVMGSVAHAAEPLRPMPSTTASTQLQACHDVLHGEKVGFGILVQLRLEERRVKSLGRSGHRQLLPLLRELDLPVSLAISASSMPAFRTCSRCAPSPAATVLISPSAVQRHARCSAGVLRRRVELSPILGVSLGRVMSACSIPRPKPWPIKCSRALPGLQVEDPFPVVVVGTGPPLLLLHGFDSSFLEFRRLAPRLVDRFQLFIPDLFGFGFSPRPFVVPYGP